MLHDTSELINWLQKENDIKAFVSENRNLIVNKPLVPYLNELLERYQIKKSDVISKAGLTTVYGYQIFDGRREPKRDKIIQLAIGFGLTLDETQRLLRYAGYNSLYPKNRRDVLFIFSINKKLEITEVDNLLYDMGESRLCG